MSCDILMCKNCVKAVGDPHELSLISGAIQAASIIHALWDISVNVTFPMPTIEKTCVQPSESGLLSDTCSHIELFQAAK